jgi:hypothetical protein
MDDQTVDDSTTSDASATTNASTSGDAASTTLTDEHHDWASNFCGIDTRASSDNGDASAGASAPAGAAPTGSDQGSGTVTIPEVTIVGDPSQANADPSPDNASAAADAAPTGSDQGSGTVTTTIPAETAAAALPAPAPDPGTLEEIEEVVESGVRVAARVVPEVVEGAEVVGAGALSGAAIAGAVLVGGPIIAAGIIVGAAFVSGGIERTANAPDPDDPASGHGEGGAPPDEPDRHDEEAYADDVIKDYNPAQNSDGDCDPIMAAIRGMIKSLRERYDDLAQHGGGDAGHRQRYQESQGRLKKLIDMAKFKECPIDTSEAEEWANYPLP